MIMSAPMPPPIRLDGISKCYRIFQNPQDRFKQALLDRFPGIFGKHHASPLYREHWALRDVSFTLQPGEAVGILGRNGAGKSTLLQIIAGILEQTAGNIQTTGRITALLELGSGFNPEFTGRENVFLNAQILGLSCADILSRFDGIVSFADIGDFIEQPVKTYSSGMMMRLAFAVQTALTPSVFIVDEALAVGDIFFQAKCMRRLRQMRENGTTILFVSHAPNTVRELCTRAILLDRGGLVADGTPSDIIHRYIKIVAQDQARDVPAHAPVTIADDAGTPVGDAGDVITPLSDEHGVTFQDQEAFKRNADKDRSGNKKAEFLNVLLVAKPATISNTFGFGEDVLCLMVIRVNADLANLWIGYKIRTVTGVDIIHADSSLYEQLAYPFVRGKIYRLQWRFKMSLMHGEYTLGCAMGLPDPPTGIGRVMEYVDVINIAQTFTVAPRKEGMIGGTAVWDNELTIEGL